MLWRHDRPAVLVAAELLRLLAADAPLLLVVDDFHWLDPASAEALTSWHTEYSQPGSASWSHSDPTSRRMTSATSPGSPWRHCQPA